MISIYVEILKYFSCVNPTNFAWLFTDLTAAPARRDCGICKSRAWGDSLEGAQRLRQHAEETVGSVACELLWSSHCVLIERRLWIANLDCLELSTIAARAHSGWHQRAWEVWQQWRQVRWHLSFTCQRLRGVFQYSQRLHTGKCICSDVCEFALDCAAS